MAAEARLNDIDLKIARVIADLGAASEVEVQSRTLETLQTLRTEIGKMESGGLIRRRRNAFASGYGDALELTELGYKSIK
jgi:hypothetical protein